MNKGSRSKFHACATCVNFKAEKIENKMIYSCTRLGYETKPEYQFNCWDPREHIRKLMKKQTSEENNEQCT